MDNCIEDLQLSLDRLGYVKTRVFPHLHDMPTIEDVTDSMSVTINRNEHCVDAELEYLYNGELNEHIKEKQGKAILNFNVYTENHTPLGFEALTCTKRYDCSREGCLAGWYVFLTEEDGRDKDMESISFDYSIFSLARHFRIDSGQAQMLFGSLLKGAEGLPDEIDQESTLWSTSQLNVTKLALVERERYLDNLIKYQETELKIKMEEAHVHTS